MNKPNGLVMLKTGHILKSIIYSIHIVCITSYCQAQPQKIDIIKLDSISLKNSQAHIKSILNQSNDGPLIGSFEQIDLNQSIADEMTLVLNDELKDMSILSNAQNMLPNKKTLVTDLHCAFGGAINYYPYYLDDSILSPLQRTYWLNLSGTIDGLPIQLGLVTGDRFDIGNTLDEFPVLINLEFDHEAFLDHGKAEILAELKNKEKDLIDKYTSISISDSLQEYTWLKDSLANLDYRIYMSGLKDRKQQMLDSMNNCMDIDTACLTMVDSMLAKYDSIQSRFKELVKFRNDYFTIKDQYDALMEKMNGVDAMLQNTKDVAGLNALSNSLGVDAKLPDWPGRFSQFNIGPQFLNETPLTFNNYLSNGINIKYEDDGIILKGGMVSQNWFSRSSITYDSSNFNLFQNNQTAQMFSVGFGSLDSSNVLFNYARVKTLSSLDYDQTTQSVSVFQKVYVGQRIFLEYEIAKSLKFHDFDVNANANNSTFGSGAVYLSSGIYLKKIGTTFSLDESSVGINYLFLGNGLLFPGTVNSGIHMEQVLLNNKLNIKYAVTYTKSNNINPVEFSQLLHMGYFNWKINRYISMNASYIPYRYNYAIEDAAGANGVTQLVNCNINTSFPLGKNTIQSVVSYSNYSSEANALDSIFFLMTSNLCTFTTWNAFNLQWILNTQTLFSRTTGMNEIIAPNSLELLATGKIGQNFSLSIGPKWLDFTAFSDQLGLECNAWITGKKWISCSIGAYNAFDLEKHKPRYSAHAFFNGAISITLK